MKLQQRLEFAIELSRSNVYALRTARCDHPSCPQLAAAVTFAERTLAASCNALASERLRVHQAKECAL